MGLLSDYKARDKLEYNNAVEESSLVHIIGENSTGPEMSYKIIVWHVGMF